MTVFEFLFFDERGTDGRTLSRGDVIFTSSENAEKSKIPLFSFRKISLKSALITPRISENEWHFAQKNYRQAGTPLDIVPELCYLATCASL